MGDTKKRASDCEATRAPLERSKPTAAAVGVPGATGVPEATGAGSAFTWQSVQASAQRGTLNAIATAQLISASSFTSLAPALPAEITQSLFRNARVIFLTSDEKSWVYHIPKWYRKVFEHTRQSTPSLNNTDTSSRSNNNMATSLPHNAASAAYSNWLRRVWELHPKHHDAIKMFGRDVLMPRFQQVYGGDGYRFSGKSFAAQPISSELTHCVETMQSMVVENTGDPGSSAPYLNGALVNWYANGEHYMGPHTDNEKELVARSPVFSLSLGATRRFVFTAKPKLSSLAPDVTCTERLGLELGDGDLVIMGGTTQETHKHALPKMQKCLDKRVNVTLRCFKKKR